MRIGLFPSKKHNGSDSIKSRILVRKNVSKTEVLNLGRGIKGSDQELQLNGARVLLRKLTLDNFVSTEYENTEFCFGVHFLLEGNYQFACTKGKTKVDIRSGCYNLVKWPNILGSVKIRGKEYVSVEVFFTREFLQDLLGTKPDDIFKHSLGAPEEYPKFLWNQGQSIPGKLRVLLIEILNCPFTGSARANYIESQIRCLLIEVFLGRDNGISEVGESQLPILDYEAIEDVVSHIKQNLKKKLTIKELSEIAGFNTTKLKSCFKKVHQTTIFKYITQLRMEKARILVLEENFTIAQASYEVGYSNPQHFTVAFKKTMGYLPSSMLSTPL